MLPMAPYATGTAAAMTQARSLKAAAVVEFGVNPMLHTAAGLPLLHYLNRPENYFCSGVIQLRIVVSR